MTAAGKSRARGPKITDPISLLSDLGLSALIFLAGIAAGITTGALGGRYVQSQLFGVNANDPAVFAVSVAALLAASLAAGFIPAWQASRIDPMSALRSE